MAIYVNNNREIENIYVSVNGEKKSIVSAYINTDNGVRKVFGTSLIPENDPYEIAPVEAYSNWNYTLDDANNIITLNYYTGSETDVIVYANYEVNGKTYKTQIVSNSYEGNEMYNKTPYMFNGYVIKNCEKIKSIKFSHLIDTSNIMNMSFMFSSCISLSSLDISGFNTQNVTNMNYMFFKCYKLENLDLNNFNTENTIEMDSMFRAATSLTSLDLSNFDTANVTTMYYMFGGCLSLTTIYVTEGKWSTTQANTSSMFSKCGTSEVTYK